MTQHELICIVNNMIKKRGSVKRCTMYDYFEAGGTSNFKAIRNFIDRSGLAEDYRAIRVLRGKLCSYINIIENNNIVLVPEIAYKTKYIIKGYQLTDDDKHNIIKYMKHEGYPMYNILFDDIARELANGNIKLD